jgi:hypothetical protein
MRSSSRSSGDGSQGHLAVYVKRERMLHRRSLKCETFCERYGWRWCGVVDSVVARCV